MQARVLNTRRNTEYMDSQYASFVAVIGTISEECIH